MYKLALLGKNISHSKSQENYEKLLKTEVDYTLFDFRAPDDIPSLDGLFANGLMGLSITSPYKRHYLNDVAFESEEIKSLKAINCVKKTSSGFAATNTDYFACKEIFTKYLREYQKVIILGAGAMANICVSLLDGFEVKYVQYSRKEHGDISQLDLSDEGPVLLINSCTRGFSFVGKLDPASLFWDLNYDYSPHKKQWEDRCRYEDGAELLFLQAKHALSFWGVEF